jgi:hypothetical protein
VTLHEGIDTVAAELNRDDAGGETQEAGHRHPAIED